MSDYLFKDTYGEAAPAIDGDQLDITKSGTSIPEAPVESKTKGPADEGLSMLQKLFYLGVIIGVCALFVRTRKNHRGMYDKGSAIA